MKPSEEIIHEVARRAKRSRHIYPGMQVNEEELIPAVILSYLDKHLPECHNEKHIKETFPEYGSDNI